MSMRSAIVSITSPAGKDRAARGGKGHAGELVGHGKDPQRPAVLGALVKQSRRPRRGWGARP